MAYSKDKPPAPLPGFKFEWVTGTGGDRWVARKTAKTKFIEQYGPGFSDKDAYWAGPKGQNTYERAELNKFLTESNTEQILQKFPELQQAYQMNAPIFSEFHKLRAEKGMPSYVASRVTGEGTQTPDETGREWLHKMALLRGHEDYGGVITQDAEMNQYLNPQGQQGVASWLGHFGEESGPNLLERSMPYIGMGLSLMGLNPMGAMTKGLAGLAGGGAAAQAGASAAMAAATGGNPLSAGLGSFVGDMGKSGAAQTAGGSGSMGGLKDLFGGGGMFDSGNLLNTAAQSYITNPSSPLTGLASQMGQQALPGILGQLGLGNTLQGPTQAGQAPLNNQNMLGQLLQGGAEGWMQNRQYGLPGESGALWGALNPQISQMMGSQGGLAGNALQGYMSGMQYGMDPQQAALAQAFGMNVDPAMAAATQNQNYLPMIQQMLTQQPGAQGQQGQGGAGQPGGVGGQGGGGGLLGGGGGQGGLAALLPLLMAGGMMNQGGDSGGGGAGAAGGTATATGGAGGFGDVYRDLMESQDFYARQRNDEATEASRRDALQRGTLQSGFYDENTLRQMEEFEGQRAAAAQASALDVARLAQGENQFAQQMNWQNTQRADQMSQANQDSRANLLSALLPQLFPQGPGGVLPGLFGQGQPGAPGTAPVPPQAQLSTLPMPGPQNQPQGGMVNFLQQMQQNPLYPGGGFEAGAAPSTLPYATYQPQTSPLTTVTPQTNPLPSQPVRPTGTGPTFK